MSVMGFNMFVMGFNMILNVSFNMILKVWFDMTSNVGSYMTTNVGFSMITNVAVIWPLMTMNVADMITNVADMITNVAVIWIPMWGRDSECRAEIPIVQLRFRMSSWDSECPVPMSNVAVIWLRRSQLYDYKCRSCMTKNVAAVWLWMYGRFFECAVFPDIMIFLDFRVPPIFSDVPLFRISWLQVFSNLTPNVQDV